MSTHTRTVAGTHNECIAVVKDLRGWYEKKTETVVKAIKLLKIVPTTPLVVTHFQPFPTGQKQPANPFLGITTDNLVFLIESTSNITPNVLYVEAHTYNKDVTTAVRASMKGTDMFTLPKIIS